MMSLGNQPVRQSRLDLRFVAVAGVGFLAGVVMTLIMSAWFQRDRTETIAALTQQVEHMQAQASRAAPAIDLALPTSQATIEREARVANAIAVVQQNTAQAEVTQVSAEELVVAESDPEPLLDPDTTAAEIEQLLQEVSVEEEDQVPEAQVVQRAPASAQAQAVLAALRRDAFAASYVRTIPEPSPVSSPLVYTVTEGDSLATIALAFYGDTDEYLRLFEANRNVLDTPDQIEAGQQLIIPEVQ